MIKFADVGLAFVLSATGVIFLIESYIVGASDVVKITCLFLAVIWWPVLGLWLVVTAPFGRLVIVSPGMVRVGDEASKVTVRWMIGVIPRWYEWKCAEPCGTSGTVQIKSGRVTFMLAARTPTAINSYHELQLRHGEDLAPTVAVALFRAWHTSVTPCEDCVSDMALSGLYELLEEWGVTDIEATVDSVELLGKTTCFHRPRRSRKPRQQRRVSL